MCQKWNKQQITCVKSENKQQFTYVKIENM